MLFLWPVFVGIYPLQNVYIRKAKILKTPKFDITKLMEVHGDYSEEVSEAGLHSICSTNGTKNLSGSRLSRIEKHAPPVVPCNPCVTNLHNRMCLPFCHCFAIALIGEVSWLADCR